jgi:hypothetical protein
VKQHKGFLHVYSEPSHGSLFRFYFPAMPGSIAEGSSVAVPPVGELRGSVTVLIADDHESIREWRGRRWQVLATVCSVQRTAKKHCGFANKILQKSRCWTW